MNKDITSVRVFLKNIPSSLTQGRACVVIQLLLITVIVFLAYSNSLSNGFTNWDDDKYITSNPLITDVNYKNIMAIFGSFNLGNYHPLVLLSYMIEYHFFKLNPFIYHLDNLLLHICNSLLLFYFIFLLSKSTVVSFLTALLFGIHPLHVESVAWVTERKDVLFTFFYFSAGICYLLYKKGKGRSYYFIALFSFILSLLSKTMAVSLPLVLLLTDYLLERKNDIRMVGEKVPFFILSILFGILEIFAQRAEGFLRVEKTYALSQNLLIALKGLVFYLKKTIYPVNLSAYYPYPRIEIEVLSISGFIHIAGILTLGLIIIYSKRWTKDILFGSLFFVATILPVLQIIPVGGAFVADRYMYIPSIGLFYLLGVAVNKIYTMDGSYSWTNRVLIVLFVGTVVVIFGVLTYRRNAVWQSNETLWQDTVKKEPLASIAHNNLGNVYYYKRELDKALEEYQKALVLNPNYSLAHNNIGNVYFEKGDFNKAIKHYLQALEIEPDFKEANYNLGITYQKMGLFDKAIKAYKKVLEQSPEFYKAHYNLGVIYYDKGVIDSSITYFNNALKFSIGSVDKKYIHNIYDYLGNAYAQEGLMQKAIRNYEKALSIYPADTTLLYKLQTLKERYIIKKGRGEKRR